MNIDLKHSRPLGNNFDNDSTTSCQAIYDEDIERKRVLMTSPKISLEQVVFAD
jgi:hypothetical protein